MKLLLVLFTILLATTGLSQDKVNLKFCPLGLIDDVSFPTIQAGIEWRFAKKTAWYNELGIRYRNGYYEADTAFFPSRGLKLKSELRYYFFEKEKGWLTNWRESYYMAVNLFYIRDLHATSISYIPKDSPTERIDNFGVKKNVFGLSLLAGAQVNVSRRISLDFYAGLGLRIRDVATSYREYIPGTDTLQGPVDMTIAGMRDALDAKGGTSAAPHLTTGLRFCWRLK